MDVGSFLKETVGKVVFDLIKMIFFFIDNVIYSFIPTLYKMILYLADINLYDGNAAIAGLVQRVYILVGVFMLFKLSFSMIRYIADPNSFSDNAKGFTSLVKNVSISLILLVTVPYMFDTAYKIQATILKSNIIPNFIMGTTGEFNMEEYESAAKDMQFILFSPFFSVNYKAGSGDDEGPLSICNPNLDENKEYPLVNIIGTADMALAADGECLKAIAKQMDADPGISSSGVKLNDFFKLDEDERNFGNLSVLTTWTIDGDSAINYLPVLSTLCGGYLVFLLLSFCFDVGGRVIKLLFLQILSPIAILSSIDPTESSQNSKLKEWGSECVKTFLSVFLRLAIMFIVVQLFKVITEFVFSDQLSNQTYEGLPSPSGIDNLFIFVFLVLGSFQVAKNIPSLIEKAFGIKLSGEINMNPFKNSFVGGVAGGVAGGLVGSALTGVGAFAHSMDMERGVGSSLVSGIGGLGSGLLRGTAGGLKGGIKNPLGEAKLSAGKTMRNMTLRRQTGGLRGTPARLADRARYIVGAQTEFETLEGRAKKYDEIKKGTDELKQTATTLLEKDKGNRGNQYRIIQDRKSAAATLRDQKLKNVTSPEKKQAMESQMNNLINERNRVQQLLNFDNGNHSSSAARKAQEDRIAEYNSRIDALQNEINSSFDEATIIRDYENTMQELYKEEGIAIGDFIDNSDNALIAAKKEQIEHTYKDIDKNATFPDNWEKIKSLGEDSERKALNIRRTKEYNDAKDRNDMITSTANQAHFKH